MKPLRVAAIVEGHGEVKALPILIQRIAREWDKEQTVVVDQPYRVPASSLKKDGVLEGYIELAARKLGGKGGILVLLDCDWDDGCPRFDGPAWLERVRRARPNMPISLVFAYKEYEAWFIAAAESIRGRCGLSKTLEPPPNPEQIRGAKEWLSNHMPANRPYSQTMDQPALTRIIDLQAARRADSFDKCYREITALLNRLRVE